MTDKKEGRPRLQGRPSASSHQTPTTLHAQPSTERWFGTTQYSARRRSWRSPDDPWPEYDVITLGLVPHDRKRCTSCQAAGR